jgi:hypothetical protein
VSGDLAAAIRSHDATAVQQAHRETSDALLRAGADINQRSHWWAGPLHVLDGAVPEIHHLVQFGMLDAVGRSLDADPALIAARGGDGPAYHGDARLVRALLDRGADSAARDAKYDGTPHHWAEVGRRHHAGGDAADHAAVLRLLP